MVIKTNKNMIDSQYKKKNQEECKVKADQDKKRLEK